MRRELPFYYEGDERLFAWMAARMAVFADPNPHWFGNPGSTLLYPLAALYRAWGVLVHGGPVSGVDRDLLERFRADPGAFYLIGRGLAVAYGLASFPLLFLVGRRAFSAEVAAAGTWLAVLSPLTMTHAQLVRTDSAGLFFGLLALLLCLRLRERPSLGRRLAAGGAIGLAVATRYFMLGLLPILVAVEAGRMRGARAAGRLGAEVRAASFGPLAAAAAFLAATPYFLLDHATALQSLRVEARAAHPGADGLSPAGNLLFYLGGVAPQELGLAGALLAGLGGVCALGRGPAAARLVVGFVALFLLVISASHLHWARWAIPVLPLLALLAAFALHLLVRRPPRRGEGARARLLFAAALVLVSVQPARHAVRAALRQWRPTTRLLARAWLAENLPAGARLLAEPGSAPLSPRQRVLEERLAVSPQAAGYQAELGGRRVEVRLVPSLAAHAAAADPGGAFTHAAVSEAVYGAFLREPGRFPRESAVYAALFRDARLLARFDSAEERAGPTVQVFALPAPR